MKEGNKEKKS